MKYFFQIVIALILISNFSSCSNHPDKKIDDDGNSSEIKNEAFSDFNNWTGSYFNYGGEGNGIRLEGKGDTLRAFDAADGAQLQVELMDGGRVIIDGAEAFVSNDTLRLVLNGSGGSHEVVYVREELNYVN
jgi:hypothetical protein